MSEVHINFQNPKPPILFLGIVDKDDFFNLIKAGGVVSKA